MSITVARESDSVVIRSQPGDLRRSDRRAGASPAPVMKWPFISVIVPTYNRPRQLSNCLSAIAEVDYPKDRFEVIVVDDGGDYDLHKVLAPFSREMTVIGVHQANSGPGLARNAGAERASGELLAFTDDDCLPDVGWLKNFAVRFNTNPNRAIGGRTVNALRFNPYATTSQVLMDVVYEHYNRDPQKALFLATCNLAVPARIFRAMGGFDKAFRKSASEDRDLCDRWLQLGHAMEFAPECLIYHAHDLALKSLWRQHFHYGRGAFRFYRARLRRGLGRVRPEPVLHVKFLCYPFHHARPPRALALAVLVALTQVASAFGYFRERIVEGA